MAASSVKTVHLDLIENARSKQSIYTPLDYSTLNEKFDHFHDEPQPSGYPAIGFLAIGNGGHGLAAGNAGSAIFDRYQHEITDAALFNQIPFIMRPIDDDLSQTERAKYRFRVLKEYGGSYYWAYYLKKITFSSEEPQIEILQTTNGVTTPTPFEPNASMLNPTPLEMLNGQVNDVPGRKLSVQTPIGFSLNADDIAEIISACEIIYSDSRYAVISEIAIVSGYDKAVVSTEGGTSVPYTELIVAQCCNFVREFFDLSSASTLLELNYELGNVQAYRS